MGNLANRLSEIQKGAKLNEMCGVEKIRLSMDADDRNALDSVLKSTASTRQIHAALRENGYVIDRMLLNLHRKNLCACNKGAF